MSTDVNSQHAQLFRRSMVAKIDKAIQMADHDSWRTLTFRRSVVAKIKAIQKSGIPTPKASIEMENRLFQKFVLTQNDITKEEYLGFVDRLMLQMRKKHSKKTSGESAAGPGGDDEHGIPDLIGALQELERQGTGNNQMMGMAGPGPGSQGTVPQPPYPPNTATNVSVQTQTMTTDYNSWRRQIFRQSMVVLIDEAIQNSGITVLHTVCGSPTPKPGVEMENDLFRYAKTKENYLRFVSRLILMLMRKKRSTNLSSGRSNSCDSKNAVNTSQEMKRKRIETERLEDSPDSNTAKKRHSVSRSSSPSICATNNNPLISLPSLSSKKENMEALTEQIRCMREENKRQFDVMSGKIDSAARKHDQSLAELIVEIQKDKEEVTRRLQVIEKKMKNYEENQLTNDKRMKNIETKLEKRIENAENWMVN